MNHECRLEEKNTHTYSYIYPFLPEPEGIHNALVFRKLL